MGLMDPIILKNDCLDRSWLTLFLLHLLPSLLLLLTPNLLSLLDQTFLPLLLRLHLLMFHNCRFLLDNWRRLRFKLFFGWRLFLFSRLTYWRQRLHRLISSASRHRDQFLLDGGSYLRFFNGETA
jgi:hypothetical protein